MGHQPAENSQEENEDVVFISSYEIEMLQLSSNEKTPVCDSNNETMASDHQKEVLTTNKGTRRIVKQLYCNKCGLLFEDFRQLLIHIFNAPDEHAFQCAGCEYKIGNTLVELVQHIEDFCGISTTMKCEKAITSQSDERRYFCEICGAGYFILTDLFTHSKKHSDVLLCCSICSFQSEDFSGLMNHSKSHSVWYNIELKCTLCSLRFYSSTPYKEHHYLVHSQLHTVRYECSLCSRVIIDDEELFVSHIQSHCEVSKKKYTPPGRPQSANVAKFTCEYCAEIFGTIEACMTHRVQAHNLNNKIQRQCPECLKEIDIVEISLHLKEHRKQKFTERSQHLQKTKIGEPLIISDNSLEGLAKSPIEPHNSATSDVVSTANKSRAMLKSQNPNLPTSSNVKGPTQKEHISNMTSTTSNKSKDTLKAQIPSLPTAPETLKPSSSTILNTTSPTIKPIKEKIVPNTTQAFSTMIAPSKDLASQMSQGYSFTDLSNIQQHSPLTFYNPKKTLSKSTDLSSIQPFLSSSLSLSLRKFQSNAKCNDCDRTFMSVQALKEHTKLHSNEWEKNNVQSVIPEKLPLYSQPISKYDTARTPTFEQSNTRSLAVNMQPTSRFRSPHLHRMESEVNPTHYISEKSLQLSQSANLFTRRPLPSPKRQHSPSPPRRQHFASPPRHPYPQSISRQETEEYRTRNIYKPFSSTKHISRSRESEPQIGDIEPRSGERGLRSESREYQLENYAFPERRSRSRERQHENYGFIDQHVISYLPEYADEQRLRDSSSGNRQSPQFTPQDHEFQANMPRARHYQHEPYDAEDYPRTQRSAIPPRRHRSRSIEYNYERSASPMSPRRERRDFPSSNRVSFDRRDYKHY